MGDCMRLKQNLLSSGSLAWQDSSILHANWKAQGSYHPMRFVLSLRPDIHRALDPAERDQYSTEDQLQAFSTYLHETIHWWQHIGSTLGLLLTLSHPAQTHFNKERLDRIIRTAGPVKSLRKFDTTTVGSGLDPGACRDELTVVLNNWHDIEFFRELARDTQSAQRCVQDPYFESVGHSFEMAVGSVLWLLSSTIDPQMSMFPDPRKWEPEFARLRNARVTGHYFGSDVHLPPLGARALFEGQARFSQIQYLFQVSGKSLTWEQCERMGMLHGIYREAFEGFLKLTGTDWPATPADPIVGLFLLVCDLAMNPGAGFPCELVTADSFVNDVDPGMRFLRMGYWLKSEGRSLLTSVIEYSKEEYLGISNTLSAAIGCDSPEQIGKRVSDWSLQSPMQKLLAEDEDFEFEPGNLPVRVFLTRFVRFQLDKQLAPHFFCWPGMCYPRPSGTASEPSSQELFRRNQALFVDRPDGDIYPALLKGKDEAALSKTFNHFYAVVAAYELTRQWISDDGPFDFDFLWLTSQYPQRDIQEWASRIFEESFNVRPGSFRIL